MSAFKRIFTLGLAVCLILLISVPALAAEPELGKYVALTFDDGPNPNYTPRLLDELAARNIKCTFFMLGQFAYKNPELARRVYDEGHQIAGHTYNHEYLPQCSNDLILREMEGTRVMLESITGQKEFMVRVPYGGYTDRVLGLMNTPVILWSVDGTNGNSKYTADSLYNNMLKQAHDGAIILLHDTSNSNINAALRFIDTMTAQGYTFVTVEELFRIKGVDPQDNTVYHSVPYAGEYFDESRIAEHWAYDSIVKAGELGLMQGDGQGFKPNEYLTRAMAVTTLWRACGGEKVKTEIEFADVAADSWYHDAVAWGAETGLVKGVTQDSFAPDSIISREQFMALIMRLAEYEEKTFDENAVPTYCDYSSVSLWAQDNIDALLKSGFISENDTSAFRPLDSITRAECAELLVWYKVN